MLLGDYGKYKLNIYEKSSLTIEFRNHMIEKFGIEKFDIVIGNPPYNKGGVDITFYDEFYFFFKDLTNILTFVIPFRWTMGGKKKLIKMKNDIFNSKKLRLLNTVADDTFKGTEIKGGICYFIYDNKYNGKTLFNGNVIDLKNGLRDNGMLNIIDKINIERLPTLNTIIKNQICDIRANFVIKSTIKNEDKKTFQYKKKTYDIDDINYHITINKKGKEQVKLKENPNGKYKLFTNSFQSKTHFIMTDVNINDFTSEHYKHKKRVITMAATGSGKKKGSCKDNLGKTFLLNGDEFSTESYINIFVDTIEKGKNLLKYLESDLVIFLMRINKITQSLNDKTLNLIPIVNLNDVWTNDKLYNFFNLSEEDIKYIKNF